MYTIASVAPGSPEQNQSSVETMTTEILRRVWHVFDCSIGVCQVTKVRT
jgi:hypothetical protein